MFLDISTIPQLKEMKSKSYHEWILNNYTTLALRVSDCLKLIVKNKHYIPAMHLNVYTLPYYCILLIRDFAC